jgi:hypothetical protein
MTIETVENSLTLANKKLKPPRTMGRLSVAPREEVTQRDLLIWRLRSQERMTYEAIGERVGLSTSGVRDVLRRLTERATHGMAEAAQEELAIQIETLGRVVVELWGAWERSKSVERIVSRKEFSSEGEDETKLHTTTRIRERVGDTKILEQLRLALADLRKLYNLEKTVNINVTWKTEIIQMLMMNQITLEDVKEELGDELAAEFIDAVGET